MYDPMPDFPPAPPVRVRPGRLRDVARELRETGAALRYQLRTGGPDPSGASAAGWAMATRADAAAQQWQDLLTALCEQVDALARATEAAVDAYTAADTRAGGRMGQALPW